MSSVRLSMSLSYLLMHGAQKEGIDITPDRWVKISDLLEYFNRRFVVTREQIEEVVRSDDKQRYDIEGDMIRIRQ